ncbi:hypothetical protein H0H93_007460, partial [Arthromyces matolae]
ALRIGIPDAMDNSFTEFFVEAPAAQLASADMNPSILLIRDTINPSITLRVSGQQIDPFTTQLSTDADPIPPSPTTRRSQRLSATELKVITSNLQLAASLREGYLSFRQSKNVVLQNPDIPGHWRFVAQFWQDYHKKECNLVTGDGSIPHKFVSSQAICDALNLGSSAIRQAIDGHSLIQRYAVADSLYFALEVAEELGTRREPPLGRDKLFKFLRRWDDEHGRTP